MWGQAWPGCDCALLSPGALVHAELRECTAMALVAHRRQIRPVMSSAESTRSGALGVGEYVITWLAWALIASATTCVKHGKVGWSSTRRLPGIREVEAHGAPMFVEREDTPMGEDGTPALSDLRTA